MPARAPSTSHAEALLSKFVTLNTYPGTGAVRVEIGAVVAITSPEMSATSVLLRGGHTLVVMESAAEVERLMSEAETGVAETPAQALARLTAAA